MNWNEIPTLVGLALNLVALVAVAYQIYLNRRALDLARASIDLAKRSIDEQRRTLQMEMLPKAYWVFVVSGQLATWRSVIEMTVHDLQVAVAGREADLLTRIAEKARKSPKGLVPRYYFEEGPEWLAEICLAAAKHYHEFEVQLTRLWIEGTDEPWWDFVRNTIRIGEDSAYHIGQLLTYIEQTVPHSYAEAPASFPDEEFIS
jgi:hypothetical protein